MEDKREMIKIKEDEFILKLKEKFKETINENQIKILIELGNDFLKNLEDKVSICSIHSFEGIQKHLNELSVDFEEEKEVDKRYRAIEMYIGEYDTLVTILMYQNEDGHVLRSHLEKTLIFADSVFIYDDGSVEAANNEDSFENEVVQIVKEMFTEEDFEKEIKENLFELADLYNHQEEFELKQGMNEKSIQSIVIDGYYATIKFESGLELDIEKTKLKEAINSMKRKIDENKRNKK